MPTRRRTLLNTRGVPVTSLVLVLAALLAMAGCGAAQTNDVSSATGSPIPTSAGRTSIPGPTTATVPATAGSAPTVAPPPPSPATSTIGSGPVPWESPSREVSTAFQALQDRLPGVRLYVPERLPAGATLARTWWPVSSGKSPSAWTEPAAANPRVTGEADDPQVSLVLQVGDGDVWFEVLERFKGDLGDLPSRPGPVVAGRPAASYRLHGGDLVQWSDGGEWFAVYGRHLAAGVTAEIAASMAPTGG